jgi:hypothetical protein
MNLRRSLVTAAMAGFVLTFWGLVFSDFLVRWLR